MSVNDVAINEDTKLVDLDVTEGSIKIYDNGQWINSAINITDDTTIGDFIAALQGYGFDAKLENKKIVISADSDKYITDESSNLVSKLRLTNKSQTDADIFDQTNSKQLTVISTATTSETTSLADLGFSSGASLKLNLGGVLYTLGFDSNDTIEDIINTLGVYGINAEIKNGIFSASCEDNTFSFMGALGDLLNGSAPTYKQTEKVTGYNSNPLTTNVTYTANGDTKLVDLGIDTGYIHLLKNGNPDTTISIDENTTVSQFLRALSIHGIAGSISNDGKINIESIGNVTLQDGTSNLISKLGLNDNIVKATYHGTTLVLEDNVNIADPDTLLSVYNKNGKSAQGSVYLTLQNQDGDTTNTVINIEDDDTIADLIDKLENAGLFVNFNNGTLSIHNGLGSVSISGGSSSLADTLSLNNADLETWMQSKDKITYLSDEIQYLSIANYADGSTTLDTLGIVDGEFALGINGDIKHINVASTDTLQNLFSRISSASNGSVTASVTSDGKIKLAAAEGVELVVGTSTDTTNLVTIFNWTSNNSNEIIGGTCLYKVSSSSKLTEKGLFRLGDITEGTFTIGNAEFTITADTTINSLISDINHNEDANASAYWDNINGKMVITSSATGASFVNIQSGTSNIAEIFGLVYTDNGTERLATYNQDLGDNAIITVNGTRIVSTSNTITPDISRIEGLTLNIKEITEGEYVTIKVERDTQGIIDAVQDALDAYNTLISELTSVLSISGDLHGDTALSGLKNQITSIFTSRAQNGTKFFRNLAAVGISTEAPSSAMPGDIYSLYLDTEKFTNALNESEDDVKLLLVGSIDNPGILTRVENIVADMLSNYGYFNSKNKSLSRDIENIDKKIAKAQASADRYKSTLERKFQNMELLYSSMQSAYSHLFSGI